MSSQFSAASYPDLCPTPTPTGSNTFKHEPLNQTESSLRLVTVLPSNSHRDSIHCLITQKTVHTDYVCLSYSWGYESPTSTVFINGKVHRIGRNLWGFLRIARLKYPHQPFWIDALCLDQENKKELNHQVQRMGSIYANARRVIVWLGDDYPMLVYLHTIFDNDLVEESGASNPRRPSSRQQPSDIQGFTEFVHNRYWTRAWIIQELIHAQDLSSLAADLEVSFKDLTKRLPWSSFGRHWSSPYPALCQLLENRHTIRFRNLMDNLWEFQGQESREHYDKLYCLLSISQQEVKLKVDYNTTPAQLAAQALQSSKSDFCLCHATTLSQVLNFTAPDMIAALQETRRDRTVLPFVRFYTTPTHGRICGICQRDCTKFTYYRSTLIVCLSCPKHQIRRTGTESARAIRYNSHCGHLIRPPLTHPLRRDAEDQPFIWIDAWGRHESQLIGKTSIDVSESTHNAIIEFSLEAFWNLVFFVKWRNPHEENGSYGCILSPSEVKTQRWVFADRVRERGAQAVTRRLVHSYPGTAL